MHFQLHHTRVAVMGGHEFWKWTLEKADGSVVAQSRGDSILGEFSTEKEARSDIAAAKKSMKGAGRCRVVSP